MIVAMTLKLYDRCMSLIFIENVYCCWNLDGGQTGLVDVRLVVLQRCIFNHDKNLPNPKMTLCATFKSFKCENFLWMWWPWKQTQGQTYDL